MIVYECTSVSVGGKRTVVVGGASGTGQAIALGFADEGADVLTTSRRKSAIDKTAGAIRELGANAIRETRDVADLASLERVRERAVEEFDGVDVVVTSQGAISRETVRDINDGVWDHVTDITPGGVRHVTQELTPIAADGRSIINTFSLAVWLSMANLPIYSVAKDSIETFTHASAEEFAPEIHVNTIASGFVIIPQNVDTHIEGTEKRERIDERTLLGGVAGRKKIVGAAALLASDTFSLVTDEVVTVDGRFANSAF